MRVQVSEGYERLQAGLFEEEAPRLRATPRGSRTTEVGPSESEVDPLADRTSELTNSGLTWTLRQRLTGRSISAKQGWIGFELTIFTLRKTTGR